MSDEDEPVSHDGQAVMYDFLKHLTTLCLFSLGGVAALADKLPGRSALLVVLAMGVIGLAAFCSFIASSMIAESRFSGKPVQRGWNMYRHASPLLLTVGLGMFLFLFVKSLRL